MFCWTIPNRHIFSVNKEIPYSFEAKRRWKSRPTLSLNPLNCASKRVQMAMMYAKGHEATTVMLTSGASGRINALFSLRAWRSLLMLVNTILLLLLLPFRGRKAVVAMATGGSQGGGVGGGQDICSGKEEKQMEKKSGPVVRVPAAMVPRKSAAADQVAARRSLAIKRVMQDDGKESVREFSVFATPRGDTMFTQSWGPISTKVRTASQESQYPSLAHEGDPFCFLLVRDGILQYSL